ncbi:class I SAM-dependent methyltransferase [Thermospira aquatica]|uniref:Methyltransferase domain-containing protein n=1 Tax=Thermospira aquatica TaxID=2828656 RepID=A0AAX3BDS7_9SPIR|nr:methyltransferase domain-containing protein [Thermospira aquatica]URA10308.1 methyltransferase domain-containing protein [Thermospira aquatica]
MAKLLSIRERLHNPRMTKVEYVQRKVHRELIRGIHLSEHMKMLSFSCGDGIWDYISVQENPFIKEVIATDIVECPVKEEDRLLLNQHTRWQFQRVKPDDVLPFADEEFDIIIHHDVLEHTLKPHLVLTEQYRVLKKGGVLLFGTPNLLRPMNIVKLLLGRLVFPIKIGSYEETGDYIHIQEFHEQQVRVMLEEIGFRDILVMHAYFGILPLRICFSLLPKSSLGKGMCHYLVFLAKK